MEGRVPPPPLARVEPGPPSNRYPRAGVEPGPPLDNVLGRATHPVVCGRPEWGGRAPGSVSLSDSASKLAHSKRFASSEAPLRSRGSEVLLVQLVAQGFAQAAGRGLAHTFRIVLTPGRALRPTRLPEVLGQIFPRGGI